MFPFCFVSNLLRTLLFAVNVLRTSPCTRRVLSNVLRVSLPHKVIVQSCYRTDIETGFNAIFSLRTGRTDGGLILARTAGQKVV